MPSLAPVVPFGLAMPMVDPVFWAQRQTLEVNVFRLKENLYGQQLQVAFIKRLRGEQRFDNIEALKEQLRQDAIEAERILA